MRGIMSGDYPPTPEFPIPMFAAEGSTKTIDDIFWADIALLLSMRSIIRAAHSLAKEQVIWSESLENHS